MNVTLGPQTPAAEKPSALSAVDITVRLGGRDVLRSVSIDVRVGEVVGLFGPSGAGKSTLFRAIAGEIQLSRGRVSIDGMDVTRLGLWRRARRGLGYLPQNPSVLWDLSVAENMAVFERLGRHARDGARVDVTSILAQLGLSDRSDVAASALSGGERRRLELARALCAAPRVLLCDEPFAAIDPAGTIVVTRRIEQLASAGSGVVIADHRVAEALELCHRAALLLDGEIAFVGSPDAFRTSDLVKTRYAVL